MRLAQVDRALLRCLVIATAALTMAPVPARADDPTLPYQPYLEVPLLVVGAGSWIVTETVFKRDLAPATCRWCAPNAVDASVRTALLWHRPATADTLSNLGAYAAAPALALSGLLVAAYRDGRSEQLPVDLLVVAESVAVAMDLDQAVKFTIGRERPFVHALAPSQKLLTHAPDDNNVSFYSGHSSWTFALATAAGTVALMHGYRLAPWILGVGLAIAASTAYLRIAADQHYLTDVLTGAAMGSAFGVGLPYLLHHPASPASSPPAALLRSVSVAVGPVPGGANASVGLRF